MSTIGNSIKLFAFFDELPLFNERLSGKRLDITLSNTTTTETLRLPEPDDTIIKTLLITDQNKTTLILFFRYVPQNINITASEADTLIIDLVPGNQFTRTYKELTEDLGRVSIIERDINTIVNPITFSIYSSNWKSFLEDYELVPQITPSLSFYFPSFPLIALLDTADNPRVKGVNAIINRLSRENWFDALTQIQKQMTIMPAPDQETRTYLALVHADILFRIGNVEAASEQFELLKETFINEDAGDLAHYALTLIDAQNNDLYKAYIELTRLDSSIVQDHPLSPHLKLSLAETALTTGHYQKAEKNLDDNISVLPPAINRLKQLRKADLFYTTKRFSEALDIYDNYAEETGFGRQRYSVNGYCSILYGEKRFNESLKCYQNLATILDDETQTATAYYLAALSQLKQDEQDDKSLTTTLFEEIINRYPDTQAALTAALKLNDLCYLNQPECLEKSIQNYRRLADVSKDRYISEEASFKEALVFHLSGDNFKSVDLLMSMLRRFQSGTLRVQAETLLIQILPGVIDDLLIDGNYIQAIALAQQNRILFENKWIDSSLLFELGLAFERLRLNREALLLFLYLRGINEPGTEEDISLALTRIAHANGDHYLVEEFSSDYFYNFPNGRYYLDVLFYRIDSLYASGLSKQAFELMPVPIPEQNKFSLLDEELYFHNDNHQQVVDLLLPRYRYEAALSEDNLYILAESLFKSGRIDESATIFNKLVNSDKFKEVSLYRLAQTSQQTSEFQKQLSLIKEIGDTTKDEQWQKFAGQELRFNQLILNL